MNVRAPRRGRAGGRRRGSAISEFALTLPVFLTLAFGMTEFANALQHRSLISSATRDGVRYATMHATSWSASASPPSNTIQAEILSEGSSVSVVNNDTDITIKYFSTNGSPNFNAVTQCGHYSQSTAAYVNDLGTAAGNQANCTAVGHLVEVIVKHTYTLSTPIQVLFSSGITVSATAWGTIQQ